MPDIKITIGGDASGLDSELKKAQAELGRTALAANKLDSTLGSISKSGGQSLFNLTEKLRALQSSVFTEKDRSRIAAYNQEIKATEAEMAKLNALGTSTGGAGAFSGITAGAGKAFGAVRQLAYILPGVGIAGIIGFATEPIVKYISSLFEATKKEKELAEQSKQLAKDTAAAFSEVGKENAQVVSLIAVINNQNESYTRRNNALKELQKIQPDYFNGLKLEGGAVAGLDKAYQSYLGNLKNVIAAKIIQAQLETAIAKLLQLQGFNPAADSNASKLVNNANKTGDAYRKNAEIVQHFAEVQANANKRAQKEISDQETLVNNLAKALEDVSKGIKIPEVKVKELKIKVEKVKMDPTLAELIANRSKDVKGKELKISPIIEIDPVINEGVFRDRLNKQANIATLAGFGITKGFSNGIKKGLESLSAEEVLKTLNDFIKKLEGFQNLFSNTLQNIGVDAAVVLSNVLAGGDIKGIFDSLLSSVGDQVQTLGKYLIKSGIEVQLAKKAFAKLLASPLASIAVGIGLVALGALLKNAINGKPQGFASGTTGVQGGGVFDVGERGRERIFLPSGTKVQPNNELKAYGSSEGGFVASYVLRGTDMVVLIERARAQMERNGGVATY